MGAQTPSLVTSDSAFAYLCRKLYERGASVCIVGEAKTPDTLRNASDQFFEWTRPEPPAELAVEAMSETTKEMAATSEVPKPALAETAPKRGPRFLVEVVALLASHTSEGKPWERWASISNASIRRFQHRPMAIQAY